MGTQKKSPRRKRSFTKPTPEEFQQRHTDNSPFLTKVLSGQHILLVGEANGIPGPQG